MDLNSLDLLTLYRLGKKQRIASGLPENNKKILIRINIKNNINNYRMVTSK